jgi:hypothetical protein
VQLWYKAQSVLGLSNPAEFGLLTSASRLVLLMSASQRSSYSVVRTSHPETDSHRIRNLLHCSPHSTSSHLFIAFYQWITWLRVSTTEWSSSCHSNSFTPQSGDRSVASSKYEFSTECDLLLPLSISSIVCFPLGHPIAAYVFFSYSRHFYPSFYLSFNNVF